MHDQISAKLMGATPTGNGRRQSFRHPPLPRMRATYMTASQRDPEEIIGSVSRGIYASSFTNGSVMIGAGDFSFYIKTGFLIEDGKLTQPIKDTNIIGNGPRFFSKQTWSAMTLKWMMAIGSVAKTGKAFLFHLACPPSA